MALKETREWFFHTHLGKLAMVSWGQPANTPVLLIHGYMDSAATFLPLVKKLPDTHYYVSVDLTGHGLSDPFPDGILPAQIHLVETIKTVVNLMNWEKFIFMGHCMGAMIGIFYNAVYPNRITKMIFLDLGPVLALYHLTCEMSLWYTIIYGDYYDNYSRYTSNNPRLYTREQAINAIVSSRGLSEEHAEVVLSRTLIPVGDGKYRLSWDPKIKRIAHVTMPKEMIIQMMTTNIPPSLHVCATEDSSIDQGKQWVQVIIREVQDATPNYLKVYANGGHEVHITNPEEVASYIIEFLKRQFSVTVKSNL